MRRRCNQITSSFIVFFLFLTTGYGQFDSLRYKLIESLSKDLYKYYVSGSLARQMSDSIKLKYKAGGYDFNLNMDEFTFEITKDLRRISSDYHITVTPPHSKFLDQLEPSSEYKTMTQRELSREIKKNKKEEEKYRYSLKKDMFIYGEIKIYPKNIGYVDIKNFNSSSVKRKENKNQITLKSVFQFLRKTNSIIIDLRENNGGLTSLAAKFCSYFSDQPNSYFISEESFFRFDSIGTEREYTDKRKFYTDRAIVNSLTKGKKIYILTSNRTFSAAELTIYKIKQFVPSAIIIGEQTRGGGNGYSSIQSSKYYTAIIPSSKSFDEINTDYNIEGRGITPTIVSVADSALEIAYQLASNEKLDTSKKNAIYFNGTKQSRIKQYFDESYIENVGDYRKVSVYVSNGCLYMLYDTFNRCLLVPTGKDCFITDNFEHIQFGRNSNNHIDEIMIKHKSGYLERFRKM